MVNKLDQLIQTRFIEVCADMPGTEEDNTDIEPPPSKRLKTELKEVRWNN